jgi:hypothetical protein
MLIGFAYRERISNKWQNHEAGVIFYDSFLTTFFPLDN